MKLKTSQSLPPDEKSMLQAIKRVHYQVYYWSRVNETIISDILLQDNGWINNNDNEEVHYGLSIMSIMVHWYVFNFIFAFP